MAGRECSIVLPTRNRSQRLPGLFDRLVELDTRGIDHEVIVVDDGGAEDVGGVLEPYQGRIPIRLLRQDHAGPGVARNFGASAAHGRLLLFLDDDCLPGPGWLRAFLDAHRNEPRALLGGVTANALGDNRWSATSEVIVQMARCYYNRDDMRPRFFPSNNMAAPVDVFREMGGFDPAFRFAAEDRDLCDRWAGAGLPLREVEDARLLHAHPLTWRSFFRQHFAYGRGAWCYHAIRGQRGGGQVFDDVGFYRRAPGYFRSLVPPGRRSELLWPLVVWQVGNAAGYFAGGWPPWGSKPRSELVRPLPAQH